MSAVKHAAYHEASRAGFPVRTHTATKRLAFPTTLRLWLWVEPSFRLQNSSPLLHQLHMDSAPSGR